ncbi:MAG TPA: hypothetical protein VG838_06060 [Opitutaceae bacterium]|nr:hypothetical protein [Opitutaceae bacterium]
MKAESSPSRFYCRVVRQWFSPAGASRHAESCADCRRYFQAVAHLESALRRDAVRFAPPAPAGLEQGIMRTIRAAAVPARRRPRPHPAWIASGSFVGIAAVALAVFLVQVPRTVKTDGVAGNQPSSRSAATGDSLSDQLFNAVVPPAGDLVANNPLQNELDSVYTGARSALDFLALNFMPASGLTLSRAASSTGKG